MEDGVHPEQKAGAAEGARDQHSLAAYRAARGFSCAKGRWGTRGQVNLQACRKSRSSLKGFGMHAKPAGSDLCITGCVVRNAMR